MKTVHVCLLSFILGSAMLLSASRGFAQVGASAGSDMWTGTMGVFNLFVAHTDYCNANTEAFVQIHSAGLGFCIEKDERPGQAWEQARQVCFEQAKRLPEVAEWRVSCNQSATLGLNSMVGNWEWSSNFTIASTGQSQDPGAHLLAQNVAISGRSTCYSGETSPIGVPTSGSAQSHPFRCVR